MQKIYLPENITEHLQQFPEHGMGYQIVNVHLNNGSIIENQIVTSDSSGQYLQSTNDNITLEDIKNIKYSETSK